MIVVLDDFSGTGESLANIYHHISSQNKGVAQVVVAPLYATKKSRTQFINDNIKYFSTDRLERVEGINLSEYSSYKDTRSAISFEYMSPDNNQSDFQRILAPLYTILEKSIKKN